MLDKPNTVMTDDARKRLAILDSEGASASAISKALWAEFGIYKTRNAVIGMIHRMGLRKTRESRAQRGAKPAAPKTAQSRVSNNHVGGRALRPAPVCAPVAPSEPPPVGGVGFLDLQPHHCRSIIGRGADGLAVFCGATATHHAYCAEHGRLYYTRPQQVSESTADYLAGSRWVVRRDDLVDKRASVDHVFSRRGAA